MKKIKFVVAANRNDAERYAINKKLEKKDWVYLSDYNYQLRGIEAKNIEFIFLDDWWLNSYYENKDFDNIILQYVILGAKKSYE